VPWNDVRHCHSRETASLQQWRAFRVLSGSCASDSMMVSRWARFEMESSLSASAIMVMTTIWTGNTQQMSESKPDSGNDKQSVIITCQQSATYWDARYAAGLAIGELSWHVYVQPGSQECDRAETLVNHVRELFSVQGSAFHPTWTGQDTWLVYAFVDATPISQPALMCTPQCVMRAMALPTVLVTPTHSAPRALIYSRACI